MESGSIPGVEYGRVDARDRSCVLWLGVGDTNIFPAPSSPPRLGGL